MSEKKPKKSDVGRKALKSIREFVKPKPKPKAKKDKPRVDAEDVTDAAKREKEIKAQEGRSRTLADKISSKLGTNMSDAKTKEGKPSKGQMKRSDGSTFGLMGDDLLKTQARRDKIEGGLKTAAVGTLLYGADQAGDYKDKKQADKKAAKAKEDAILHYNKTGSLQGYESTPLDFESIINSILLPSDYENLSDDKLRELFDSSTEEEQETILRYLRNKENK